MRKFVTALISLIFVSLSLHADNKKLCVQTATGSVDKYELAKTPTITFTEDGFKLTTTDAEVAYPSDSVEGFYFEKNNSATDNVFVDTEFYISSDKVSAFGNCELILYSITGELLSRSSPIDNCATISLTSLPSGVYIVSAGNRTIKIKH